MRKLLSLAFLSIVVLSFSSCKKDDDVTPAVEIVPTPSYAGTWSRQSEMGDMMKVIYTASSYEEQYYTGPIQVQGAKGTVKVTGDLMTSTKTEVGLLAFISVVYYKVGTPMFTSFGGDTTPVTTKFTVVGNTLTVMTDDNKDNVYGGSGDKVTVFTKQ